MAKKHHATSHVHIVCRLVVPWCFVRCMWEGDDACRLTEGVNLIVSQVRPSCMLWCGQRRFRLGNLINPAGMSPVTHAKNELIYLVDTTFFCGTTPFLLVEQSFVRSMRAISSSLLVHPGFIPRLHPVMGWFLVDEKHRGMRGMRGKLCSLSSRAGTTSLME